MSGLADPRAIIEAFANSLNDKDAEAVGALFSPDAEFVNIMGMRMSGRDGIVKGHSWRCGTIGGEPCRV